MHLALHLHSSGLFLEGLNMFCLDVYSDIALEMPIRIPFGVCMFCWNVYFMFMVNT